MAKKQTTTPAETREILVYDIDKKGFILAQSALQASELPAHLAMVRDEAHHFQLLAELGNSFSVIRGNDGFAAKGDFQEPEIPKELFVTIAIGQRAIQLRNAGFWSLDDAVSLSTPEIAAQVRKWAAEFNAYVDAIAPRVSSGELTTNAALAAVPMLALGPAK